MFNVIDENGKIAESAQFAAYAARVARNLRDERKANIYVYREGTEFVEGEMVFFAFADGREWDIDEDGEFPCDADEDWEDEWPDEPYDPYDEVGYNPYTGGYDSDL